MVVVVGDAHYKFGFNGQEKVNEIAGIGNHTTALFWEYDTRIARRWNLDPVVNPSVSLYSVMEGNPIWKNDVLGDDPSTHIDKEGRVKAVYNDGDKGVYKHDKLPAKYARKDGDIGENGNPLPRLTGGTKIGETEYWDEFADLKTKDPLGSLVLDSRKNASWDYIVGWMHNDAMNYELPDIANMSKLHKKYDLKNNDDWAGTGPGHEMTGRLLNGKWATARSAGNFLAGWNGATGRLLGQRISGTTYLKMAGALNQGKWNKFNAAKILIGGKSFGNAPYYGEDEYSGRRIVEGLEFGGAKK